MRTLPPLPRWIQMEHRVAEILTEQEIHGWHFDESKAQQLESYLRREMEKVTRVLREQHPFVAGSLFTPKRDNATQGYREGCAIQRIKEFNPTSRDHIAWILQTHYKWEPTEKTPKGKALVDESTLRKIGTNFSNACADALDLKKKIGMISEGVNAWAKLCTTSSRIHHHCSVNTNTHRCAHRKPNLAQVPAESQFRELFKASPNHIMVGADLSGIELRMLAHYLGRFDGGKYADILLNGDIHQVNADKIGITRRQVKTVTYAFLYGAGNVKLGLSFDSKLKPQAAAKKGQEIRKAYVSAIDGLDELLKTVSIKLTKRGFLFACDGRPLHVDSPHKALNYLLQCGAGVVAKLWMVIADNNLRHDPHTHQLAFIHDELQYETLPEHAESVMSTLEVAAASAGEYYKLRCPIAAEAKSGNSWADVH